MVLSSWPSIETGVLVGCTLWVFFIFDLKERYSDGLTTNTGLCVFIVTYMFKVDL